MKHVFFKVTLIAVVVGLTSCAQMTSSPSVPVDTTPQVVGPDKQGVIAASVDNTGQETSVNLTMAGGGEIGLSSMDANDKLKMSRALDGAPGKATHWQNGVTGINYTVTPIKKVVIDNNPFCRQYLVAMVRGAKQKEVTGTACVTTDGSWHTV